MGLFNEIDNDVIIKLQFEGNEIEKIWCQGINIMFPRALKTFKIILE